MGILTQPKFHQCAKHCIRAFGIFLEADGFWEGWGRSRLCPPPTWLCDPGRHLPSLSRCLVLPSCPRGSRQTDLLGSLPLPFLWLPRPSDPSGLEYSRNREEAGRGVRAPRRVPGPLLRHHQPEPADLLRAQDHPPAVCALAQGERARRGRVGARGGRRLPGSRSASPAQRGRLQPPRGLPEPVLHRAPRGRPLPLHPPERALGPVPALGEPLAPGREAPPARKGPGCA